MHGGSGSTADLTCGRRETVEKCGEQPQGPCRKCARQERSLGEKERNGRREAKKATSCTSSSTFPLQQPQQQQQCVCNDAHGFHRDGDNETVYDRVEPP